MAYIPRLIFIVFLEAVEALQPHHRPEVPAMLDALVTLTTFFKSVECLSSVPPTLQPSKVNFQSPTRWSTPQILSTPSLSAKVATH